VPDLASECPPPPKKKTLKNTTSARCWVPLLHGGVVLVYGYFAVLVSGAKITIHPFFHIKKGGRFRDHVLVPEIPRISRTTSPSMRTRYLATVRLAVWYRLCRSSRSAHCSVHRPAPARLRARILLTSSTAPGVASGPHPRSRSTAAVPKCVDSD
jgi:hypothetical protein